jgi:tRNA(Ile2)-agmatinylcytidine synthase
MRIGIDDTDSPAGMCTTYLGALLARKLSRAGMLVREARLVRLNPNVLYKTRGNAAICLDVQGKSEEIFSIARGLVEDYADFSCENTNPGLVAVDTPLPSDFYYKAVRDFCTVDEALSLLKYSGARYKGYKNGRGLIGATAAVCSTFIDPTYELLAYRVPERWGTPRVVDPASVFSADEHTYPHTWDSVDRECGVVVCVPHTPDPVLFGIRGERPGWVSYAREWIVSERPSLEQIFKTNQGTDEHLVKGHIGALREGCSYMVKGRVSGPPVTRPGGHVSISMEEGGHSVRCMAYEPTKGFRDIIRSLRPGDEMVAAGSYKGGSINLEKILVVSLSREILEKPPICERCGKRMTSAGTGKGYKCRRCGGRSSTPERIIKHRSLSVGWYEVTASARRHLAKPLCRGPPDLSRFGL